MAPKQDSMPDNEYTFIVTAAVASFLAQLISLFLGGAKFISSKCLK